LFMKKWVISLGGSRIIPNEVDEKFLEEFKNLIDSHPSQKFVIVTGGGSTARKYISALKKLGKRTKSQSMTGIAVTRLHAGFMARLFGPQANEEIPKNMEKVKNLLRKNHVVFCGALRYQPKNTSDGTAANLAAYLKCSFINITNVPGLYTSNPKKNKNAKKIKNISWKKFEEIASKIKFKAGQHFVLDQNAAKTILKNRIPTYIIGSLSELDKILKEKKKFDGTLIVG
jgi:uridylate kinase